jgi:hypothetical protein
MDIILINEIIVKEIIISIVLVLLIANFIVNYSFAATMIWPIIVSPIAILSNSEQQYPLCPAGYMVLFGGGPSHSCIPMPVNYNQTLNIEITPLTMIKEFEPNEPIPVSHTRLILSDRFGIDTTYWWPTLLRPEVAPTPTHAIIIEVRDHKSQNEALTLGFKHATPADLSRVVLSADPYIGTELSAGGGSTWPNITIGKAPWWWPYSFR